MGSYLSEPVTEKVSSNEDNDKLKSGASSMQGWRITQEDAHNCLLNFDENTALFAVYDGHGGHEVAVYCSKKLPDYIKSTDAYKNGDMEKALIDAFLGFDATIATREVVAELQEIVGLKQAHNESDNSDVEDNVKNLCEEATMPLEQVIEKYTSNLRNPNLLHLQSDSEKHPTSPYLRARKDNKSSTFGEGSSGNSLTPSTEVKSTEASEVEAKENEASKIPIIITDVSETDDDKISAAENLKLDEKTKETDLQQKSEAVQNGDKDHNPSSQTIENGEVSKKGKVTMKTKGVPDKPSSNTRPKRNAQQLYSKLLHFDSESESEEENDKTYQGPEECSSDEDVSQLNNVDDNSESENLEEEDEYDETEEEEEDCELDEENLEFAKNMREEPGSDSGCTAVVALLRENKLYVANAGDSRCIVCRDGKAVEMSFDHKPEDDIERERVIKAGGKVTADGRVNGGLNLSRAIGDHAYKQNVVLSDREQMITALPDVRTLTVNPAEDEFMVLACDGIWNFMSSQQVVDFVKPKLEESSENVSRICEELFDHCLAPNTLGDGTGCDNMTAIIVQFKNRVCKRGVPDGEDLSCSKRIKTSELSSKSDA